MQYLITGGAGFIGSHLADALIARGDRVLILDDLSTGNLENLVDAVASGQAELVEGSACDEKLVDECMERADACFHLASAVGVKLIVEHSVKSLLSSVHCAQVVTEAAHRFGRRLLFASTSEIYGKNSSDALSEHSDRVLGPPSVARWSYSTAKAFGEAVSLGYHREKGADTVVARLFNTVGPRQSGAYGMVLPCFVGQALAGEDLTVYGDGSQSRCFAHVDDTVQALMALMDEEGARGRAFNVGRSSEITILELAQTVIERTDSTSGVRMVPYEEAYGEGFEELGRRRPDTSALEQMTGWKPKRGVEEAIDDVAAFERMRAEPVAATDPSLDS
ncbi:MAG TPA: NAD-dependent epimerase/dehydratase family protein [Solirubrobacterales bacterium]|nr:NAD-dependent epimerase/dehydratase family protein [Solirubrobacterales bacterium]